MSELLNIENLSVAYGAGAPAVNQVSFTVGNGAVVALLGANGAGKSSIMKAVAGLTPATGSAVFEGEDIGSLPARTRVARGIVYVPEGREIVGDLSVRENLILGGYQKTASERKKRMEMVLDLFPEIAEKVDRQAWRLSGGEQQMLAIGRALARDIKLLLLDEPYEGLAPVVRHDIEKALKEVRAAGITTVLVEQNAVAALKLADRAIILDTGEVAFSGSAREVLEDEALRHEYLAI